MYIAKPAIDRFWKLTLKTDTCWLWQGTINRAGYGLFGVGYERWLAHRWAYSEFIGHIPEGYDIDHVRALGCVNRNCVNPNHLEAVTHTENMNRVLPKRRSVCKNSHPLDEENTYISGARGGRKTTRCRKCNADKARAWRNKQITTTITD